MKTENPISMVQESMRQILQQESSAILSIPVNDNYDRAVSAIVECNRRGGKLICSGMGKAGQIAMNIATTFSSTGTPAVYLHPSEAQHGDLGVVQPLDLMLIVSNSGKTRECIELLDLLHGLYPQIEVIVITGKADSPLAERAQISIFTGGAPEVCPLGLTPTVSTTVMTVIGDVLVVNVMREIGFTRAQYALRHHGGYLGSAARKGI